MQGRKPKAAEAPVRALVTGGAGFIGSHLTEALLASGQSVTVLDDQSTGQLANLERVVDSPRFRFVAGSVRDEDDLDALVRDCDVIYHLAAAVGVQLIVGNPLDGIETNVLGTHAVLRAAHRYGRKVLLASTSEVYGKSQRIPFQEDDDSVIGATSRSRWSYAYAKALDECLALSYYQERGLPVVVFRLFNTVGPRQTGRYGMVVPRFVQQALSGEQVTVYGSGRQSRCFCDVADAIRAIVGLSERPDAVGRVYNVGSGHEVTVLELAIRCLRVVDEVKPRGEGVTGWDHRIRFVPYDEAYGAGFEDMQRRVPDTTRVRELLCWQPDIRLDETLRRVRDYQMSKWTTLAGESGVRRSASPVAASGLK